MWKLEEFVFSSDESFEEEVFVRNLGNFEVGVGVCKFKLVFENIFVDI